MQRLTLDQFLMAKPVLQTNRTCLKVKCLWFLFLFLLFFLFIFAFLFFPFLFLSFFFFFLFLIFCSYDVSVLFFPPDLLDFWIPLSLGAPG
ncbi:hypothetical protein BDW42DRAFT_11086 [Aspergillus taichungensis]|uniref:Uncharacterized protein n=1 Tax=Aspergillus taichungensis TaxID=482145 RepID=A0A2J5I5U5_9EURO|nr:hypothetical protein BDW42DRAFT_11086 [Aspergillus taichungensis]